MSHFTEFEYSQKQTPFNNKIKIRPLTDHGFHKYLSNVSYVHNYLDKTILKNYRSNPKTNVENPNNNNNTGKDIRASRGLDNDESSEVKMMSKTTIMGGKNYERPQEELNNQQTKQTNQIQQNNQNQIQQQMIEPPQNKQITSSKSCSDISKQKKTQYRSFRSDSNNPALTFYAKPGSEKKKLYDYYNSVRNVKDNMKTLEMQENPQNMQETKRYDGFKSYNVPRIQEAGDLKYKKLNLMYTQRITKSVGCKRSDKFVKGKSVSFNQYQNLNVNANNQNNNGNYTHYKFFHDRDTIKNENDKLKKILKADIICENNNKNPSKSVLPRISAIAKMPNLKIKRNGIGNSKELGDKYNPYSYIYKQEVSARNPFGALFQN